MTKRHYKKKALPVCIGETAPKERHKQQGGVVKEVIDRNLGGQVILSREKAIAECVLDAYYLREYFSDPEYQAGIKLRHAYLRAVLGVHVDDIGAGSHHDPEMRPLMLIQSERLLRDAYALLTVSEQAVIIAVCGHDNWVGSEYRMKLLCAGLGKLATLWKIS